MKKDKPKNDRYPHKVTVTRLETSDDPFQDEATSRVLYQGKARCYTDTTVTGGEKVMRNRRKISIPVRFDEWEEPILTGDRVDATIGKTKETWVVSDFEPDNDRTVVYCEMERV